MEICWFSFMDFSRYITMSICILLIVVVVCSYILNYFQQKKIQKIEGNLKVIENRVGCLAGQIKPKNDFNVKKEQQCQNDISQEEKVNEDQKNGMLVQNKQENFKVSLQNDFATSKNFLSHVELGTGSLQQPPFIQLKDEENRAQKQFDELRQELAKIQKEFYQLSVKINQNDLSNQDQNQINKFQKESWPKELEKVEANLQQIIFQLQNEQNAKFDQLSQNFGQINLKQKDEHQKLKAEIDKLQMIDFQQLFSNVNQKINFLEHQTQKYQLDQSIFTLNQQSITQEINLIKSQIQSSQHNISDKQLSIAQEIRKNLSKLLDELNSLVTRKPQIIKNSNLDSPFDPTRLKNIQNLIQKLYDETYNQRAVDFAFRPFVRSNEDNQQLKQNYGLNMFYGKDIKNHCNGMKPVRGDGNCFYTAFGFQFFQHLLCNYEDQEFFNFIKQCQEIQLPMKLMLSENNQFVQANQEKDLREELFHRLIMLRKIENVQERMEQFEKQYAAYEKLNDEVDGCLYGLVVIFLRNYSNYAVDFHEMKEALFDRQNLLIWEKECHSNEILIDALARKLNLFAKLFYMEEKQYQLREYGQQDKPIVNLLIRPGHYNIGIAKVQEGEDKQKFQSELPLENKQMGQNQELFQNIDQLKDNQDSELTNVVFKIIQILIKFFESQYSGQESLKEFSNFPVITKQ